MFHDNKLCFDPHLTTKTIILIIDTIATSLMRMSYVRSGKARIRGRPMRHLPSIGESEIRRMKNDLLCKAKKP